MNGKASAWNAWPAVACALAGVAVFQFLGNANRGYIDTASLFYWWGFQWFNADSETQHGLLILALSGWLLVRNLREGEKANGEWRGASGAAAMIAGLALHALGFAAQQARISIVALLLFAWGVAGLAGGKRGARAAAFPLMFLLFAVPLNVLDSVGFWLRLWVIEATEVLARLAGVGLVRSGTQLFAPDGSYQYDVAAACSGVRSLMALAALTLLLGYLHFRSPWRRLAILALCFPLTYLGNVVRISGVVFAGEWFGQAAGERVHDWAGFLVFVIVLGGTWLAISGWERWWPERIVVSGDEKSSGAELPAERRVRGISPAWAVVVVTLAAGEMIFLGWLRGLPARGEAGVALAADGMNPVALPAFIGTEWAGRDVAVSNVEREILPADTGFSRKLYAALGDPAQQVFVSVVLSGRDRTSIHRPELCLVGQGMTIESTTQRELNVGGVKGEAWRATLLRGHREVITPQGRVKTPELVVYWFVSSEAMEPTQGRRLWRDAWNRVWHARADRWAYVLVQTGASDGEEAALARMQAVLESAWPRIRKPRT